MDVAPLLSVPELTVMDSEASPSTPSGGDELALQRAADAPARMSGSPLAQWDPRQRDHPEVGLVGEHPIEAAIADTGTTHEPAGGSAAPPAVSAPVGSARVPGPSGSSGPATMAVQRSVGATGYPAPRWSPDPLAVSRSVPAAEQQITPAQLVQFVSAGVPIAAGGYPPQQSPGLVVQRVSADEPAATGAPETTGAAGTGPATTGAAAPGGPAGSTSPTEVDALVRKLYDPIVRRLKAELQLDRERAGRSLDLWH